MQVLCAYRKDVMPVTSWSLWQVMTKVNLKMTVVIFALSKYNLILQIST